VRARHVADGAGVKLATRVQDPVPPPAPSSPAPTALGILAVLSFCHLINDMMQSVLPAIYPLLKGRFALDFGQVGIITLTQQLSASVLQPVIGMYTDRRPKPYSLAIGMGFTLAGMVLLSAASHFYVVLAAAALIGLGSAVFHPESSRIARLASGGRHGFAQSLFQVGGNVGLSLGSLIAAFVVLPLGQASLAWFALAALLAIVFLGHIGTWYKRSIAAAPRARAQAALHQAAPRRVAGALAILVALIFSKYIYLASLTSYYTFYLIERFGVSVQSAQLHLFGFLGAVAVGTLLGGPIGDRIGRRPVILWSIVGVLPFTLLLPYADLFWTRILTIVIGLVLASAFSAIVVYAQELVPGRIGMISGLFFGLAFGAGGIGAAVLGTVADRTDIVFVYQACSFLPLIGLLGVWLPNNRARGTRRNA
jgi:MFS transporter, FSR family, fosmidomycin resistance protein